MGNAGRASVQMGPTVLYFAVVLEPNAQNANQALNVPQSCASFRNACLIHRRPGFAVADHRWMNARNALKTGNVGRVVVGTQSAGMGLSHPGRDAFVRSVPIALQGKIVSHSFATMKNVFT